jgi:hypothetical protein
VKNGPAIQEPYRAILCATLAPVGTIAKAILNKVKATMAPNENQPNLLKYLIDCVIGLVDGHSSSYWTFHIFYATILSQVTGNGIDFLPSF